MIAVVHWMTPKTIVNSNTNAATQNVYHCTLLRSSYHHCATDLGSASSKACLRIMIRSLQNLNFLISRPRVGKWPHFAAWSSNLWFIWCFLNHFWTAGSLEGSTSAKVLRVSSINSSLNRELTYILAMHSIGLWIRFLPVRLWLDL